MSDLLHSLNLLSQPYEIELRQTIHRYKGKIYSGPEPQTLRLNPAVSVNLDLIQVQEEIDVKLDRVLQGRICTPLL